MKEGQGGAAVSPVWKGGRPCFWQVVGVDGDVSDASLEAAIHDMGDKRTVAEGDEGLRESLGHGAEPSSQSSTEEESFAHEGKLAFSKVIGRRNQKTEMEGTILRGGAEFPNWASEVKKEAGDKTSGTGSRPPPAG